MAILDGKVVSEALQQEMQAQVAELAARLGRPPGLAVIMAGDNPASRTYVASKSRLAEKLGFHSRLVSLPEVAAQAELLAAVDALNGDPRVDGFLVQLPLPAHIDQWAVLERIDPAKDADCFHPVSQGRVLLGTSAIFPCTPAGVLRMLDHYRIDPAGMEAVIVGRSFIVGKPLALMLANRHATVTLCHSRTRDLAAAVGRADLLVAAVGKPAFVMPEWVKPGAVVIDVGINHLESEAEVRALGDEKRLEGFRKKGYAIVGDVHPAAHERAAWHTPVPGGVGLMTVTMLLANTLTLCRRAADLGAGSGGRP